MIDKIKCENRIGNDIHKELIAMWNEIQKGWEIPLHISEEEYNLLLVQEEMNQNTNDNLLVSMAAQAEIYERLLEQEQNQLATMAAIAEIYEKQNGGV